MRRLQRKFLLSMPAMPLLMIGGTCLPDNAFGTVLGEQFVQTAGLFTQGTSSLLFGLPDAILNTITLNILLSLFS